MPYLHDIKIGCPTWIRTMSSDFRGRCVAITPAGICLAEEVGVEPNPRQQDQVFKACRRTNPAASSSIVWHAPTLFSEGYV